MTGVVRTVAADDDVALHVEHEGAGTGLEETPTVVFTHGVTGATSTWDRQRELLRGQVPVVVWDQRGHGLSGGGPPGHATVDQTGRTWVRSSTPRSRPGRWCWPGTPWEA